VASHMLHFATARYTAEHAGGLRLKPLTEALVYFAGIMTERGEDEMALKLLKDLDWKLTELHNLYPQDDTIVVMRGHVRYDIAMKLKRQGDYTHLETLLVGCAQDYESSLGSDARELEGPLSQLAEVMAVSERHHHAFKLIDRVEKLMNMHRTAGAMTAVEASQRIMLTASRADALAWAGRLDRAHPMLNEAMDMAVEKFGVTHHMVASMLLKKGTLTFQTGGIVDAMCYYEEAAEVYEELEFSDLGTLSGPIKRLVGIYMLLGRNDMALALIEQYIVLVQADPANRSSELSEVSLILRMLQRACGIGVNGFLGREDPAFIFAQTQPVINFTDQDGNPMTVDDLVEGANRRYNRGEFDEALRLQERCVYEMREHLGEMHPLVAQEVKFLGAIYQKEEMYTDALACYQEATAMFIRALGEDHPQTAQALNYQGVCECAMMKFEESAATMERVVEIYKRNLHKEHPTLSSAQRLAGHCNLKVAHASFQRLFAASQTDSLSLHCHPTDWKRLVVSGGRYRPRV
jgi:tetratricopeptide (TPR) repeat protein